MQFSYSYTTLTENFFAYVEPKRYQHPQLVLFNEALARSLNLPENLDNKQLLSLLLGQQLSKTHRPIAQAYAGHQFGHFTMLGDGRAMLIGETHTTEGQHVDIHLKGSGRTPYSRNADGNATLGPMLREYCISEAMDGLGIPTTRSLAVITTGETVYREQPERGAILVRVAKSHLRVGTFEYAATLQDKTALDALLHYTLKRHYPNLIESQNPALNLLNTVMEKQIDLITEWMRVGFIHGVMNTDNMSISGETLDYGPCAFMNQYHHNTVFSSIDRHGRYCFGNQPVIAKWNLARLAEALLPLIDNNEAKAIILAQEAIEAFDTQFEQRWHAMMSGKLGLNANDCDKKLIADLLAIMEQHNLDYTNTFYGLTYDTQRLHTLNITALTNWIQQWKQSLNQATITLKTAQQNMQKRNPVIIPRNHLIENVIQAATVDNDVQPFVALTEQLRNPYQLPSNLQHYQTVPVGFDDTYQTFCGT